MPLQVVLSEAAEKDLRNLFNMIREHDRAACEHFIQRVEHAVARLAHFPRSGAIPRDPEVKALGYRFAVVDPYLVFYSHSASILKIIRILHGHRYYGPVLYS